MLIDEKTWAEYKITKSRELKNRIIEEYMGYVGYIVNRIMIKIPDGLMREDLFQFGILGLMEVVDKYDNRPGVKFESYAGPRIHGKIVDEIRRHNAISGGPTRTMIAKMKKIENAIRTIENKEGRTAEIKEIADELGITVDEYYKMLGNISISIPMSLDKMVGVDENLSALEVIENENSPQPEKRYGHKEIIKILIEEIDKLPFEEHRIIVDKYYEDLSLREISYKLGLSQGRISQLHTNALIRLKNRLDRRA